MILNQPVGGGQAAGGRSWKNNPKCALGIISFSDLLLLCRRPRKTGKLHWLRSTALRRSAVQLSQRYTYLSGCYFEADNSKPASTGDFSTFGTTPTPRQYRRHVFLRCHCSAERRPEQHRTSPWISPNKRQIAYTCLHGAGNPEGTV